MPMERQMFLADREEADSVVWGQPWPEKQWECGVEQSVDTQDCHLGGAVLSVG